MYVQQTSGVRHLRPETTRPGIIEPHHRTATRLKFGLSAEIPMTLEYRLSPAAKQILLL